MADKATRKSVTVPGKRRGAKLEVSRPGRPSDVPETEQDCVSHLRKTLGQRYQGGQRCDVGHRRDAGSEVQFLVCQIRKIRGQHSEPKLRYREKMRLREIQFNRLRELSAELNEATRKATGIYRCLAIEVRELLKAGVYRGTITRELIDSGRTASRASELLSVAELPDTQFEHFALGDMTWNLALVSSRLTLEQVRNFGRATGDDWSRRDSDGAFPGLVPSVEPTLPGIDPGLVPSNPPASRPVKQLPMRLSEKESQLQTMAKLRVELAKVAKFSRKGGLEEEYTEEIGGYRITIQPLKK